MSEINLEHKRLSRREELFQYYRYLRFIISTGKLFKRKKTKPGKRKRNKLLQFIRISGYLARKGKLFRLNLPGIKAFLLRKTSFLLDAGWLTIIFNSTILFLLAFTFEFLLFNFSTGLAGLTLNMKSVIYYYDIDFLVRSRDWSIDAIKIIYSSGPFISLIICLLSIIIYMTFTDERWMARLFIFWIFCHAFTHSIGAVLSGALLSEGFGYVIMYMFWMDTAKVVISIAMIVILVLMGIIFTRSFLLTGNIYFNDLKPHNRMPFVYSQFIIPFLAGTGIILLLKVPKVTAIDIMISCSMAVFLFPFAGNARSSEDIYFDDDPRKIRISWRWLMVALPLLALFRIIFAIGVRL